MYVCVGVYLKIFNVINSWHLISRKQALKRGAVLPWNTSSPPPTSPVIFITTPLSEASELATRRHITFLSACLCYTSNCATHISFTISLLYSTVTVLYCTTNNANRNVMKRETSRIEHIRAQSPEHRTQNTEHLTVVALLTINSQNIAHHYIQLHPSSIPRSLSIFSINPPRTTHHSRTPQPLIWL